MDDFRVKLAEVVAEVLLLLSDNEMNFFHRESLKKLWPPLGEERIARTRILGYVERVRRRWKQLIT